MIKMSAKNKFSGPIGLNGFSVLPPGFIYAKLFRLLRYNAKKCVCSRIHHDELGKPSSSSAVLRLSLFITRCYDTEDKTR